MKSKRPTPKKPATKKKQSNNQIGAWEDDPESGLKVLQRPVPNLGAAPYSTRIQQAAPPPKEYKPGTSQFRYWTAAEALRRGSDFWGSILGQNIKWQPGAVLLVDLDHGEDLNAYYDRVGLRFFHGSAGKKTVYSGESPDVVCHEMGHAILDSIRPELWDAASAEIAAFHESFGDMSAILCDAATATPANRCPQRDRFQAVSLVAAFAPGRAVRVGNSSVSPGPGGPGLSP